MYTAAQGFTERIFTSHRIRSPDSPRRIRGAEIGGEPLGSNPGASFRTQPRTHLPIQQPGHQARSPNRRWELRARRPSSRPGDRPARPSRTNPAQAPAQLQQPFRTRQRRPQSRQQSARSSRFARPPQLCGTASNPTGSWWRIRRRAPPQRHTFGSYPPPRPPRRNQCPPNKHHSAPPPPPLNQSLRVASCKTRLPPTNPPNQTTPQPSAQ